jgi:hypothetical protein
MEVPIVPEPRLHLGKPRAVLAGVAAQRLLDGGVHEQARHARILRRGFDQHDVRRRPHLWIDILAVLGDDHVAIISSRSIRVSACSGMGVSQISTSRPR